MQPFTWHSKAKRLAVLLGSDCVCVCVQLGDRMDGFGSFLIIILILECRGEMSG